MDSPANTPENLHRQVLLKVNLPAALLVTLESAFSSCYWAYAVKLLGSASLANLSVACFWVALFASELPTGYLLDRFGPKRCLMFATSTRICAFALFYAASSNPWLLMPANLLAGFAVSFLSGLFFLQIRLELSRLHVAPNHTAISASVTVVRGFGVLLGTSLGYLTLSLDQLAGVWLVSIGLSFALMALVQFLWRNMAADAVPHRLQSYRDALALCITSDRLRSVIVDLSVWRAAMAFVTANMVLIYVPRLADTPTLLYLYYLMGGALTLAAAWTPRLMAWMGLDSLQAWIAIVLALFFGASLHPPAMGWLMLAGGLMLMGSVEQRMRALFFAQVSQQEAGAITSMQNFADNLFTTCAFVVAASLIDRAGVGGVCMLALAAVGMHWIVRSALQRSRWRTS